MIVKRDETFRVVFNLRTKINLNSTDELVGTGIFVVKNNVDCYLVTATHVASTCNDNTIVLISDSGGNTTPLKLKYFNENLAWRHHPIADISVLPVQMSFNINSHMDDRFFPLDHFHLDNTPVSRDFELTSVGFPNGLGASGKFSPLTYRSYASSSFISLNRFDNHVPSVFFYSRTPASEDIVAVRYLILVI